MGLNTDREFRFAVSPWWVGAWTAFVTLGSVDLLLWLGLRLTGGYVRGLPFYIAVDPWMTAWWNLPVFALGVAFGALELSRLRFLRRRSWVEVTGAGLTARDWAEGEQRVFWADIRELRVRRSLGALASYWRIEARGQEVRVRISDGVEAPDELVGQVIARADLTERQGKWWGVVYTRPTQ